MRRLLHRAGASSTGKEVFHSLRGAGIEQMLDTKVDARDRKQQAGHKLETEHDLYGFRAISEVRAKELSFAPLREGLDFSVFRGLDFDKVAKSKRTMGRRPKQWVGRFWFLDVVATAGTRPISAVGDALASAQ